MTTMTFDDALLQPGRKLQTSRDEGDGRSSLTIYSLAGGGATPLAEAMVSSAEHAALAAMASARGCERAETEPQTRIVWVAGAESIEVFDRRRRQFSVVGSRATLVAGRIVARSHFGQVFAWASDDYAHRGIKATVRSGAEIELVTEISLAATGDPTYNRNDLLADSGWCTTLGRAIATWAGVSFENRI